MFGKPSDLGHLGRALRVDEADPLAVEHERRKSAGGADDIAHLVLESVCGGEEEVAVEPDDGDAGRLLVIGVTRYVSVDLRARLTAKASYVWPRRHRDEPQQRQCDADHDSCKHAEHEGRKDRSDRDPEVEALNAR